MFKNGLCGSAVTLGLLVLIVALTVRYVTWSRARRHYINNILKQWPYLLGRYAL